MTILKGVLKNTIFLTGGNVGSRILMVVFIGLLARATGPIGLGKYSFALSLIAIFMILHTVDQY